MSHQLGQSGMSIQVILKNSAYPQRLIKIESNQFSKSEVAKTMIVVVAINHKQFLDSILSEELILHSL